MPDPEPPLPPGVATREISPLAPTMTNIFRTGSLELKYYLEETVPGTDFVSPGGVKWVVDTQEQFHNIPPDENEEGQTKVVLTFKPPKHGGN
jgi:hypothetical protein